MPLFENERAETRMPLFAEPAVDFESGKALTNQNGDLTRVTGRDALVIWVRKALDTESLRFAHAAHTAGYGNEFARLLGAGRDIVENRMREMIRSCLLVNPYITGVGGFVFTHGNSTLEARFTVSTIYGDLFAESEAVYS